MNLSNLPTVTEQLESTHPNREGAPSYSRSLQEQTVQVLTTGTLGDTFYVKGRELAQEAIQVLVQARDTRPEFLARALVYAREVGLMKTLPILGLAILSGGRGRTKSLFQAAFRRVIQTPDDLRQFVLVCKSGSVSGRKGLGGMTASAAREWFAGLSEYHALKYGSAASKGVTLRDILRLTHPRPATPALAERFGWLVGGVEKFGQDPTLNHQLRCFENLKRTTDESEVIALIREGRLPYEVVVPALKSTSTAVWSELLRQAPYFNLLRSLVAFTRHGVFASEENVRYAVEKLTNPRAIERSRVLPFRFFDAWRAYGASENQDNRIADALRTALNLSFVNMPSLGSRTVCIGPDVSGSMGGGISDKGTTRFIDIAGIFTGALLRRIEGRVVVLPFDTRVHTDANFSGRDDVMVTVEKLSRYCGGGTAVGAPLEHLLRTHTPVDVFIGITDGEDWCYGSGYACSGSFLENWRRYRQQVSPNCKAFLVTIAPYRDGVALAGEPGVHFTYGWSDAVIRYIALSLETGGGQINEIERMQLESRPGDCSPEDTASLPAAEGLEGPNASDEEDDAQTDGTN